MVTQDGMFRYRWMPMGVLAAPGWFQHVMNYAMARSGVDSASAFLDDCNVRGQ